MAPTPCHLLIIGAGCAGARLAKLAHDDRRRRFRVTLLAPAKDFLHTPAAVRLCVAPHEIPQYTCDLPALYAAATPPTAAPAFTFLKGRAVAINFTAKTVTYASTPAQAAPPPASTPTAEVTYDKLVIATGAKQVSPLWGFEADEEETYTAMRKTAAALATARRVAVVGGGLTGIEVAAEIAEAHPRLAGEVVLFAGDKLPAETVLGARRASLLVARLEAMGVDVRRQRADFLPTDGSPSDSPVVTNEYDVVLDARGPQPDAASFLPNADLLDGAGWIKTDKYLRVAVDVYAMGDVVSGAPKTWPDAREQASVVLRTIEVDLGWRSASSLTPYSASKYKNTIIVTLGRAGGGVGLAYGWPLPACLISWVKGRDFLVNGLVEVRPI